MILKVIIMNVDTISVLKMKNQYSTFSKTMQIFQRVGGLEGGLFDRGVLRC